MMTDLKEINKHYRKAKWHFNKAIELSKKNTVVGEIVFPRSEKKVVKERLKKLEKAIEQPAPAEE